MHTSRARLIPEERQGAVAFIVMAAADNLASAAEQNFPALAVMHCLPCATITRYAPDASDAQPIG